MRHLSVLQTFPIVIIQLLPTLPGNIVFPQHLVESLHLLRFILASIEAVDEVKLFSQQEGPKETHNFFLPHQLERAVELHRVFLKLFEVGLHLVHQGLDVICHLSRLPSKTLQRLSHETETQYVS